MVTLFVNIGLGIVIFGYTAWQLRQFFQKRKKGACETCMLKDGCNGKTCMIGLTTIQKKSPSSS